MTDNELIFAQLNRMEGKIDAQTALSAQQHTEVRVELSEGKGRMDAIDKIQKEHADIIQEVTKLKNKAIGFAAAFILLGSLLTFIFKLILS